MEAPSSVICFGNSGETQIHGIGPPLSALAILKSAFPMDWPWDTMPMAGSQDSLI